MATSPTAAHVPTLHAAVPHSVKVHWFRSTYFQAVVLGFTAFLCPGLWGALANLGAGGLATPRTSNTANATLFSIMTFTCLLGAPTVAKVGPKWALIIGTLGYAPYAAGLYSNSRYGAQWPLILGAVVCGLSAGIFWSTEGAIALAYGERDRRARMLTIWLALNQFGSIIGGAINLSLNANRAESGSIGLNSYAVFVALQCCGPLAAFLLSEPNKVQRHDGTKVVIASGNSFLGEIKAVLKLWATPRVLILTLVFIQCQWSGAATGTYLASYLSVRARALSSLVTAFAAQALFYCLGYFLDSTRWTIRFRATASGLFIFAWLTAGWIWIFINQVHFGNRAVAPSFDWTTPGFGNAWVSWLMQNLPSQLLYNWLFWIVSFMTSKGEDHIRYVGIMRSAESVAQCLSFGVSATSVPLYKSMAVNLALLVISFYPAWSTVQYVAWRDEQGLNAVVEEEGAAVDAKGAKIEPASGGQTPESGSEKDV